MRYRTLTILAAISLAGVAPAQQPAPKTFASAEEATQALIGAASSNDSAAISAILGSNARGMLTSGDTARDEAERSEFARIANARHRLEPSAFRSGVLILLVGDDNWPFPAPLVRAGQMWRFDPAMGSLEVRARRVGANELDAIEVCAGYVEAQQKFATEHRSGTQMAEYARTIMKGLYDPGKPGELVPAGFAEAAVDTAGHKAKPYHGYYFRVLTEQGPNAPGGAHRYVAGKYMIGGFALIAWPAEYGVTGIHAFVVNQDNIVYEKDLGARTAVAAAAVTRYDPDKSWMPVN